MNSNDQGLRLILPVKVRPRLHYYTGLRYGELALRPTQLQLLVRPIKYSKCTLSRSVP